MFSAWYGGLWPGLLATIASALLGEYYFIEPIYSFRITSHSLARQAELALFIVIGVSISMLSQKRLSAEAKRQQLLFSEREARQAAEVANRLKDEFLATISHELRSPLNAILGWTVLLRKKALDSARTDQALETIERNSKIQSRLIEDLLDVSRIISGKLKLNSELVELRPIIEAAADVIRPVAEAKGIQISLALDSPDDYVMGDPTRLEQVVWNILSNAVKFTPSGGKVHVTLDRIDSKAQIIVRDTGRGIGPEFLPYVFDRFKQADSKSGGMGLGLSIARTLVEMHGGAIEANSDGDGQGATFLVRLPLVNSRPDLSPQVSDWEPRPMMGPRHAT
jgi:signal transduction histidine kinase